MSKIKNALDMIERRLRSVGKIAAAEVVAQHAPLIPTQQLPDAVPLDKWPPDIVEFANRFKEAGDKGVGDIAERQFGRLGEAYKKAMEIMKLPCWCNDRKAWLNALYPL